MRPGWQTSEFWITLVGQVLALCVLLGLVQPADQEHLQSTLNQAITAVFGLTASVITIVHYVHSRTALKQCEAVQGSRFKVPSQP
jgi:hypothetical protein